VRAEIAGLRQGMDGLRQEMRAEMAGFRQEMEEKFNGLRQEVKAEIAGLRQEVKAEINTAFNKVMLYFTAIALVLGVLTLLR